MTTFYFVAPIARNELICKNVLNAKSLTRTMYIGKYLLSYSLVKILSLGDFVNLCGLFSPPGSSSLVFVSLYVSYPFFSVHNCFPITAIESDIF